MNAVYKTVRSPEKDHGAIIALTDETMAERKAKILSGMKKQGVDQLVIYNDVEHAYNFMYLTGYFTRFEEGLLILNANESASLVLGNESLGKATKARIEADPVLVSQFSLPNQPDFSGRKLEELLQEAGIIKEGKIGLVGWKLFTSKCGENDTMFDLPSFIVESIRKVSNARLINATGLFIGEDGARTTNNANEIAHYEYGASLASDAILDAMNRLEVGVKETELGDLLVREGQHTSVVTIAASGERFIKANMFPTDNRVRLGDTISLTNGYFGGSSSRAGYAVHDESELPEGSKDYLDKVVRPYFNTYVTWLETIRIGMKGRELYRAIEDVLPKKDYGWKLNPGHLTAEEEWLCSPVREDSKEILKSGMLFQIDIIPSVKGYGGVSAESTVALADETLKKELEEQYPEVYARMCKRRKYIIEELGIDLSEDVLPMCSTVAYLRPCLLNKECAMAKK